MGKKLFILWKGNDLDGDFLPTVRDLVSGFGDVAFGFDSKQKAIRHLSTFTPVAEMTRCGIVGVDWNSDAPLVLDKITEDEIATVLGG